MRSGEKSGSEDMVLVVKDRGEVGLELFALEVVCSRWFAEINKRFSR